MAIRRAEFVQRFEVEALEPRVMLSADGFGLGDGGARIEVAVMGDDFDGGEMAGGDDLSAFGLVPETAVEVRALVDGTAEWTNPAGGDWNDAANWQEGHVPVAGDDVVITGLADGVTITLTGDTPELSSLAIDGGQLTINGALRTGNITGTGSGAIRLSGGTSSITGDVTMSGSFEIFDGATLTWSGESWDQSAAIFYVNHAGSTFVQQSGVFSAPVGDQVAVGAGAAITLIGGQFSVPTDAALNLYHDSVMTIAGAELRLAGGTVSAYNESTVAFTSGLISGAGDFKVNNLLEVAGTIRPGGEGTPGTLNFVQGEDHVDGAINFAGAWAIELDVLADTDFDRISFDASVTFGGTGAVTVNASLAEFSGAVGTALPGMLTVDGAVAGIPTPINVTAGPVHAVSATWAGSTIDVNTERLVPAWTRAAGGDWTDPANWANGRLPGAGEDVVIAGLNADAVISLSGNTPVLGSLTIESGALSIDGVLATDALTVADGARLELTGSATSLISGNVTVAAGAELMVGGTAVLIWSGSGSEVWDHSGQLTLASGTEFRATSDGTVNINAGRFEVDAGAEVNVTAEWGNFFVRGGEFRLNGTFNGSGASAEFAVYSGTLSGAGVLVAVRAIEVRGTISPGGDAGDTGWLQIGAEVNFNDGWLVHLDVLDVTTVTSDSMDFVSIAGDVNFAGTGRIEIDASAADFDNTPSGTQVGDANSLFYSTGSVTGEPTVAVIAGPTHAVTAAWNATRTQVETYSPITATWINDAGGDWSDTANWANGRLPTVGEDVSITGLNADAVITIDGLDLNLGNLSLDQGQLVLTHGAALNLAGTDVLTLDELSLVDSDLTLAGNAVATIRGDVNVDATSGIALSGSAKLTQTGGTWNFNGSATFSAGDDAVFIQNAGQFRSNDTSSFAIRHRSTWTLNGGIHLFGATATAEVFDTAILAVAGGTLQFAGTGSHLRVATLIEFTAGSITGSGALSANGGMNFAGTLNPGDAGNQGVIQLGGEINFTGAWNVFLQILSTTEFDQFQVNGAVTWGGTGAITLDASSADFTDIDEGTVLAGLVTLTGPVTGDAADLQITVGAEFGVTAEWDGTTLKVATVGGVPADNSGAVVAHGISSVTTTLQGMLDDFDLSGATFSVPTLPSVLDDLFDLSALSASLALPSISGATDLASTIAALRNAGYTVDTSDEAVDFTATFTRTVATDRALATGFGDAWVAPTDLFAGFADTPVFTAVLDLMADLVQHVVFELRNGSFTLLSDTYLALTLAGGASLSGTVRQGGRTVSTSGSTTVGAEVRVHHGVGGATATGQGTVDTAFTVETGPLVVTYTQNHDLSRNLDTLVTSVSPATSLNARLSLADVAGGDLDLVGTLGGDGQSWTLAGSGSSIKWLGFDVADWTFNVDVSASAFGGTGRFDTALDFLSTAGETPDVSLSATFDQDELTFSGTLSDDLIAVSNPAGGTYLRIENFSASVSVTGDLVTDTWSGALTFTGGDSTFGPEGASFTASITDGDDEDNVAVEGSYDFSTQAFSTSVDQFELVAENIVRLTAAGVTLRHQRDVTDEQELLAAESVTLELLFLTSAPSTGPPTAEAADLSIRTNGITVGAGSLTRDEINIGSALSLTGVSLRFTEFAFLDGGVSTDSVTLAADAAVLFPDGGVFSAAATNLSGTYDFGVDRDRIGLTAETLTFDIDGLVELDAANVVIRPDGDLIFAAESIAATLIPFDLSGEIKGLQIGSDGTPSAVGFTVDTRGWAESLDLGGLLPLEITGIDVAFLGDTNDNGVRDDGEIFRLDAFDLTIRGTFDFGVMAGLPFTPVIHVGDDTFEDGADEFAVTLRSVEGSFRIWETERITLGVADLQIGNLFEIAGSVTLGGYTEGEWVGEFGGNLVITSLNETVTGSATATVKGAVDVEAGAVAVETEATLDLGIGTTLTLSDATMSTDFTLTREESGNLTFAINTASAAVGTLRVGSLFEAADVSATLTDLEVGESGVTLGAIRFTAGSATVLPDNELGITATTTGFSGSYDFTTDPNPFVLTAESVTFELVDVVSFNAAGVSLTPLDDVVLAVDSAEATLAGLDSSAAVMGFELASDGTPSATSIELDTEGLADSLQLGGMLPLNITAIALAGTGEGERITFTDFDLTVEGNVDFSVFAGLPFTPFITIGEQTTRSDDETAAEFSFTVRMEDGGLQVQDSPTITLGIEDLQIGNVLEIQGSITLGGYSDGDWVGALGGSLTLTALQVPADADGAAPTSITVEVSGQHDVDAGTLQMSITTAISFGLGEDISFVDAGIEVDFTLRQTEDDGLELMDLGVTATAGTMTAGAVLTASEIRVRFSGFSISSEGVGLTSIHLSAGSATLFPDSTAFTATVSDFSGSYDFSGDGNGFELTAGSLSFAVGDLVTFDATDVMLRPEADVVVSIGEIAVELPGIGTSGTITGFELTRAAVPSAVSLTLDTSGLSGSLQLGGILPFELQTVSARFLGDTNGNGERDEGEIFRLDEFDLSVDGTFDFDVLSALPFTPIVRIGDTSADDGADSFSFTIRIVDGTLTPWDVGPIELGVADLAIGSALVFGGTIRLGGYAEGVWVPDVGGSLDLTVGADLDGVTGSLSVEIDGSWTEETGVLEVGASFLVSFTLGDYVEVTDAAISLSFDLTTQDSEGEFELGLTNLGVGDVSIKSLSVSLGDVLSMSATSATLDFEATGDEALIEVGALAASLGGLGISGTAQNFAVAADGGLLLREDFGVSLQLGEDGMAGLSWPAWLPIEVTVFEVQWDDIEADPLDFTLRLSGTISTEGLSGSKLTLAGSVSNLIIDVGLLQDGAFPIVGLGEVGIAVGGDIAGSAVSAQLLLGILRVDADGNRIADDDTTTVVADRVLWGAVRGGIEIAGYGGFEVFLGVSEYGPLQGYVKAVVVVPVDPTGLTGLSLTNFRAGITFNSELPAIDDPKELAEHPEFVPTADLSFTDWRDVMLDSLSNQLGTLAAEGAFGLLLNPFRLEGGVTLFSAYASQATFNIDADFIMDSTGKFVALGAFQIGGTINFTASLYLDLSDFVADGDATILFLGQLPSELPIVTLYGRLSFNFGETIDPDNPPANPLEQFVIEISGGMDVGIASLPTFTVDGEVAFDVALNAPSLRVTFSGRATISQVGDLVGISGDMRIFFGEDDTVKVAGVAALAPAEMTQLQDIGLTLDALAVLRFNTTDSAIDQTLEIPGQSEARTFTLAPGEGSILIEGIAGFAPGGVELFRLGGLLNLTWTDYGFDVLASGELTAGPVDAPLLRFGADGYLRLVVEGINVGMAAQFTLTLDPDNDLLAVIGVELDGDYAFVMNTTGEDVDFTLPTELAATAPVERINLPRGPPAADGATSGEAMSYLFVRADGILTIQDAVELRGVFDFTVADSVVALDYEAVVWLGFGEVTFYEFAAEGHFRIDGTGLYGQANLTLDLSAGIPAAAQAFDFEATFQLQVNTTGEARTLGEIELAEGTYARVRATGDLIVGVTRMSGVFDLLVDETGVLVNASGSVSLGIGDTLFYTWGYDGTLRIQSDGIYGSLELRVSQGNTDAWGFGFVDGASYTLALNTTGGVIGGVPAGLGAQVKVAGALELGDWTLDGTYTLTASTTGLGFGAAAALVFRDGERTLFSVPVNFEVTLNFPGIRERVELDLDPADLGLEVPGLALSGEFYFVINTTPDATAGIPAGPILQLGLAGAVTVGGAELAGSWTFDSSLSRTRMTGDFTVGLGGSGEDALLRFDGAGGLNLGLDGVAGYTDLTYAGAVESLDGLLDASLTYHLVINTSTAPYELGDRTLPKGPLVEVSASGDLNVGGLTLNGDYGLTVSADGMLLDLDATLAVTLGEDALDLFTFEVTGGLALSSAGLVAALDLEVQNNAFADVGLGFDGGADFRLRVNTTGADQSVGDIELEQGNYARVEFSGVLNVGVFYLAGDFTLQAEDGTADLTMDAELYAQLPDTAEASFRFVAVGGLRIEAAGVVAALDLDAGSALQLDGMEFPFGAEQTVALRLNTTGQKTSVNGIELAEGNYFRLETVGTLILGPYLVEGTFGFTAADTGFTVHAGAQLGIGVQDSEFMRFRIEGEISVTAGGTYALLSLVTELGDGHDDYGFGFGAGATVTLGFNSTDNEVNGVPARSAWALVVTGTLQLGDEANGGALTGQFSVTPTVQNTLLWHGETSFVLTTDGTDLINLPFEFDYEMDFPGMAMRVELPLDTDSLLDIPGLTYDGEFYLEFNATDQDVPWGAEASIPAGPAARLVFDGTLGTAVTTLNGRFAFQGDGDGVRMLAGFTFGLGPDAANPWVSFDAEGAFVVSSEGFAGYAEMTVAAGLDALAGPLGGELTHTLLLNTTAAAVTVGDHNIAAGPRAELLSSGTLDLLGLAMVGDFRLSGSDDGFSMEADANLEIRVPFTNIALLKVPVEGGFTISDKGFSAAFDVLPETAFFEPVGLAFGSTARYTLRVNTTGEARTENGIELEAGTYGRVDASGTLQLGDLVFEGGYTFQVDADLVRFGVNADVTWELPVAGNGPTGELLSFASVGQLGIGADGVVGALDLTPGTDLERLQLGEVAFDVSGELAWALRLNTTGSERVVEGVTLGANEVFMFETDAAFALGPLAVSGLTRFTAGDELVRVETIAAVVLTNPATTDELIAANWIGGFEISAAGVAGYGEVTGAAAGAGLANTGLTFLADASTSATTTLSFNTTGSAVDLEGHTIEATDHFEVVTAGEITVLGQRLAGVHAFRVEGDVVTLLSDGAMSFGLDGVLGLTLTTTVDFTFSGAGVFGTGAATLGASGATVQGFAMAPVSGAALAFGLNSTNADVEQAGTTLKAGSVTLAGALDLTLFDQTFSGQTLMSLDFTRDLVVFWQDGSVSMTLGDWSPFSFDYSGYFVLGADGVATRLALDRVDAAPLDGIEFTGAWEVRASTFAEAVTLPAFSVGALDVPEIAIEAGHLLRFRLSGAIHAGGMAVAGEFDFAKTSVEFMIQAVGSVDFFGVSATFNGQMYLNPDRGFVANVSLTWDGIDNTFMTLSGEAFLRINTWDGGLWEGLSPSTFEVGVYNASLRIGFSELTGWAAFQWFEGEAYLWSDMSFSPIPGLSARLNGFISTDGTYDLAFSGSTDEAFGVDGLMTLTGSYEGRLTNESLTGSWDGRIDWPTDYSSFNGSFAITSERMELHLALPRTWLLGIGIISGEVTIVAEDGRLALSAAEAAPLRMELPGGLFEAEVWGTISSTGTIDFNGRANVDLGEQSLVRVRGDIAVRVSNSGFAGTISGRIDLLDHDYTGFTGEVRFTEGEFFMSLDVQRVWLLGVGIISGRIETYQVGNLVGFNVDELNPLRLEVVGGFFEAEIWGYIWSDGVINFNGRAAIDVGSTSLLRATADLDVHVDNNGFSAAATGEFSVLGSTSRYTGSIEVGTWGFDLNVDHVEIALLGGLLSLEGGARFYQRSTYFDASLLGMTARLTAPGLADSSGTVSGYVTSTGRFELDGSFYFDLGDQRFIRLRTDADVHINNDGFSGSMSGRIDVMNHDYTGVAGSLVIRPDGDFAMSLDLQRVWLLGFGIISGRIEAYHTDGRVGFEVAEASPLTLEAAGGLFEATVWGYVWSDGQIDFNGRARLDVGDTTLGLVADLGVQVDNDGFRAEVSGTLYVPGDNAGFTGTLVADAGGFDISGSSRFVLAGGLVLLDGSLGMSHRDGVLSVTFEDIRLETRIPGWDTNLTVDGYIRSDGDFYLSGTADLNIGNSTLGVDVTVTLTVRDEGIAGAVSGRLYVPGDFADLSGSFEAGSWGVNLHIERVRFVLLSGAILLDGSMIFEMRGSGFALWIDDMTGEIRLPGFTQTFAISGAFDSEGNFDLSGTARLDIGSRHIGATGDIELRVRNSGITGSLSGTVYVPGDYAGISGTFSADADGFEVNISRVRFVVLGGTLLIDGSLRLISRNGGLYVSVPGASVTLWGITGSVSGYFDSANGTWRVDGSVRFHYGGNFGAEGTISFDVGHDHARAHASGKAWAQADYWFFGWRTYRDWASFSANVDLGDGRLDVRMKFWKFYVTVHVRLKGGFRVWLSNVGGSTVFLDVNRNGALDDGEPFTLTDADGNFDFAEVADPDAEGNEVLEGEAPEIATSLGRLAAFDLDGDGVLAADEIQLYAVNGISGSESSDFRLVYRDDNGNGRWDGDSETSLEVSFDELSALSQTSTMVTGTRFEIFDDDGDGVLSDGESASLSLELIGARVPLTLLPNQATGGITVKDAEFVFADANGNGQYDPGEPTATPDEFGIYTFLDGAAAAATTSLGRLAPFDTNGNGRIDPSEGVFVVMGGTDTDNGVANPVAATALAEGYGGGIEQTINPLTSLQVSLVDRGMSIDDAADLIENAFNLPRGVDVDSFDPNADSFGDPVAEAAVLGAGAMVTSLITGGAGLLGDDSSAGLQDAVLDQLADMLITAAATGSGQLDLTDAQTVATVIVGAGVRAGRDLDETVANAAANVLANVNVNIAETVAAGGNLDRALAANKAVFLTEVNASLTNLGDGTANAADVESQFSDAALDALQSEVTLLPTIAPALAAVDDQLTLGSDLARITLAVLDPDSRASELSFTVSSSNESVVAAEAVSFENNNGEWTMLVPTAALATGTTVLSVTVSDGDATASTAFTLSLDGLNPVVRATAEVPNQTLGAGETTTLNLADFFDDPNGDATYSLVTIGANRTVDAAIVDGQLVLTARSDLSGLAVFDLVATDGHGTASTRFSVVSYPTVSVSDEVRYTNDGRIEMDVTLSNPATQSLSLRYHLAADDPAAAGPLSGRLTFAPGETTRTLSIDLASSGFGDVRVQELSFGVTGSWATGSFAVDINNRNPVELLDLRNRLSLSFAFTLVYDFMADAADEDEARLGIFADAEPASDAAIDALVTNESVAGAARTTGSSLVAATSLEALERPRALSGI